MKKLISTSLMLMLGLPTIIALAQHSGIPKVAANLPCQDFHRKACLRSPDDGFAYNGQSRSGLFAKGQSSTIKAVFYKGMDYHISVCCEEKDPINFSIKDAKTGEVLYDNSTDNNTNEIQLTNENTRHVNIMVTVAGGDAKIDKVKGTEGMCVGLLIEHKKSDKVGF
ncbi:MAG: hypothetical protein HY840_09040 [Bacteroidetes bacterium]|nr:hypothetical protein [Bacteroidota bacterium]